MNNSLYLDQPLVLTETEAKILTAAPGEKEHLQQRAEVLREWLTPRSTILLST